MHTAVIAPGFNLRAFGIRRVGIPDFFRRSGSRTLRSVVAQELRDLATHQIRPSVSPTSFATGGLNRGAFILTISGILEL